MCIKKILLIFGILSAFAFDVHPQEVKRLTSSRKAARSYQNAIDSYTKRDFCQALISVSKALRSDNKFIEAYLLAGDISLEMKDQSSAITYYEKAINLNPSHFPPANYILGNLYYNTSQYDKALSSFKYYAGFRLSADEKLLVQKRIELAEQALELKSRPVLFEPVNLCHNINTENDEYVNAISADGQSLIFTVRTPNQEPRSLKQFREEFYVSQLENYNWQKAKPLRFITANSVSEGALALSYDNKFIFFTSCHQPDGFGSCDLYYSKRQGDLWSEPQNLGPIINSSSWESQPSLSSDGRTLYFASSRPGGFGGSDIWKSVLQTDGTWSRPENLGDVINTAEDEMSPYIHADGQTLYFSSKGHPGLGGADLFISRLQPTLSWSEPMNLGYPINTTSDEINIIIDPQGMHGYISSSLPQGKGGYDIYKFELHENIKPLQVSYFKGIVRSSTSLKPLDANIDLIDLETSRLYIQSISDASNGEFLLVLPTGKSYALNVNRKGYLFYSHHFPLDTVTGIVEPVILDIFLKPVELGQTVILKNVFFAHNSYELESSSLAELNLLVDLLNENPGIGLEILGHTDNTGTVNYNLELSNNRARAVFNYLVDKNIEENRISYTGMGDKSPVDTNSTPEGRANNRRTEFRIVNYKNE
ncbi:MAG: PD40 domain-containing protein [Bacteroidales bacterium]|nr:PD40 domain-containing protein [Bacteroidales bacterium]